jgi:hypothetical protein
MVDCAIIRDLLPLYVDGILSNESKALISNHFATCENCKQEFVNMQSEIREINKVHQENKEEIDTLKSIKKKIFRQKLVTAVLSSVVVIAIVVVGIWFVLYRDIPIKYADGNVRAEVQTDEENGSFYALNIVSTDIYRASYATGRILDINGTDTQVVYFCLGETLSLKWRWRNIPGQFILRFAYVGDNNPVDSGYVNDPSLPMELYYLAPPFDKFKNMTDEDFYAQRNNGVLLWSGTLE